ncbi:MAG: S-layer homology domain-containing protein [Mobilitalea sp.]
MKHKLLSLLIIVTLLITVVPWNIRTVQAKEYAIKDMDVNDEAYQSVQDVLNQGWMSLTLGRFYPDKNITRAEFTMVFTKFNSQLKEAAKVKKVSFKDVALKDKFGKYIELQKKYVTYYKTKNGNYFKPNNYLTREDALVAIVKILGYDTEDAVTGGVESEVDIFELLEDSDKITPALKNIVSIGVTNELIDLYENSKGIYLYPKQSITRKQLALLLSNAQYSRDYSKGDAEEMTEDVINGEKDTTDKSNTKTETNTEDKIISEQENYLKIETNGKSMSYTCGEMSSLSSTVTFKSDKYSNKNSFDFVFGFPSNVEAGDTIVIDSKEINYYNYYFPMDIKYTNVSGDIYYFGYPLGGGFLSDILPHSSSKMTIKITGFGGKGGYITGTMEGEIILTDGEIVTFTNGEFCIKLAGSRF